ncbi:MAG: hypothetical protein QF440_07335 [Candidatus Thalassarchaeaceae archaeon]|jgi:ribosomal protein S24E|nr:hypothetical protein [Candidatus Thalassarchaeaceae archaeon]
MEITDRKENPILNRVELSWTWRHVGNATPTRAQIIEAVAKIEPGATKDRIVVKSVSTRYGQPLTSGNAFVYDNREDLEKEPKYILERHSVSVEANAATADPSPEEDTPTADAAEEAEIAGGEE